MIKETHTPKCTTITISWSDCDKETFGGYHAHDCKIHGNIEAFSNPHHDCDGSKCSDYRRVN